MTSKSRYLPCSIVFLLMASFPLVSKAAPPSTPGDFRYEVYSDTAAELFWNRTTNVAVRGYEITRNGESLGVFDSLSYFDDTLARGVDYAYSIVAVGVDGERSGVARISLRTPRYEDDIASLQQTIRALQREIDALESRPDGGPRAPVPRTGQEVSVQPGDDGDLQSGVSWPDPRFTSGVEAMNDSNGNGACDENETCDGTVTDELTGLVWLGDAECFGELGWSDAIDAARALAADNPSNCALGDGSRVGDWRLPNVKEIQSLIDYGHEFPEPLLPPGHPFVDVQIGGITDRPASYWTSTSTGPANDGAYTVSMSVGWVERLSTSGTSFVRFVWPVRDAK